jgi:hypothetical protein
MKSYFHTNPGMIGLLLLVLALACHLALVFHFNFTQDDAYITFRYAANYLNGDGLVYNIGEKVEGYTNFLWTILIILGKQAGIGFVLFSKILGAIFGLATILINFLLAKTIFSHLAHSQRSIIAGLCCLVLGMIYSFAYWTVAGLETAAFTFMIVASLYLYLRRSYLLTPVLVMSTLLRPEGGLVFAFIILYEITSQRSFTRYASALISLYILFLLPFTAFKLFYYASLLPNPFYAKTSFNFQQVIHGLEYSGQFFWHYLGAGLFVIPTILVIHRMPRQLRICSAFLLLYAVYITLIGGDVLKVHRFFVPIIPLFIISIIWGIHTLLKRKLLFIPAIILIIVWQIIIPKNHVQTFHSHENSLTSKMDALANKLREIDQTEFSVAVSTIGMLGYRFRGHTVIDLLGLTDSTIARHPEPAVEGLESSWRESHYNSRYVLSRQPDYIIFSTNYKPSAPAERALFLYSKFLKSYRTIGFYLGGSMQNIFKKFHPITAPINRDVDFRMVQYFNRGLNLQGKEKDFVGAIAAFDSALIYSPEPKYPYLNYSKTLALRQMGNFEETYRLLREIVLTDTLVYNAYMNLYLFEMAFQNHEAAQYFRARTAALVPWYMPRLDSLANQQK